MPQRLLKHKFKTETYDNNQMQEFKGEISKLKNMIIEKNLEKSLLVEDKLRRLARLSTKQIAKSAESPRSAVNYISLSPQSQPQAPMYNPYPFFPPPMPSYPYMQNYPYMSPPPHAYH